MPSDVTKNASLKPKTSSSRTDDEYKWPEGKEMLRRAVWFVVLTFLSWYIFFLATFGV